MLCGILFATSSSAAAPTDTSPISNTIHEKPSTSDHVSRRPIPVEPQAQESLPATGSSLGGHAAQTPPQPPSHRTRSGGPAMIAFILGTICFIAGAAILFNLTVAKYRMATHDFSNDYMSLPESGVEMASFTGGEPFI